MARSVLKKPQPLPAVLSSGTAPATASRFTPRLPVSGDPPLLADPELDRAADVASREVHLRYVERHPEHADAAADAQVERHEVVRGRRAEERGVPLDVVVGLDLHVALLERRG